LLLPGLPLRVKSASVLGGSHLKFEDSERELRIEIPAAAIEPIDTVIKLELEQPWTSRGVIPVPDTH